MIRRAVAFRCARLLGTLALVAACGGTAAPPAGPSPELGATDVPAAEAGVDPASSVPVPAGCGTPADMRDRECEAPDQRCEAEGWVCECYPEPDSRCSGAVLPPMPPSPPFWHCTPLDPATLRDDGCPWGAPASGSACSGDRTCHYGEGCGGWWANAVCTDGAWAVQEGISPPPP